MKNHWSNYETPDELRAALVAHIRTHVGVRYRHQGRNPQLGLDCLGVLISCARDFGLPFTLRPRDNSYSLDPNGYELVERLSEEMVALPDWRDAQPADVVLMRWHITRPPQHVGVVTVHQPDNLICVHSSRSTRRVVETRWDRLELVTNAFRIRELAQWQR